MDRLPRDNHKYIRIRDSTKDNAQSTNEGQGLQLILTETKPGQLQRGKTLVKTYKDKHKNTDNKMLTVSLTVKQHV